MIFVPPVLNKIKTCKWLLLVLAFSTSLWSFSLLDMKVFQYFHILIICYFFVIVLRNKRRMPSSFHYVAVLILMLLPLCSIVPCYMYHGQAIKLSLIIYRMHLGWLIYFVLWYKKVSLLKVLKVVFIIAIVYTIISLVQQITYPFAPFGGRTVGTDFASDLMGGVEKRMGFYRFLVGGSAYCMMASLLLIGIQKTLKKGYFYSAMLFFVLGILALGSRTTLLSYALAVAFCYLFNKDTNYKILYFILIVVASYIFYAYSSQIFGKLANIKDDLDEGRLESYLYYFKEIFGNTTCLLWGNGLPHAESQYGIDTALLMRNSHIIWTDIGFLGTGFNWGFLYVGFYMFMVFKFVFNKYLDIAYKAILLMPIFICVIQSPLWEFSGFVYQGVLFYLCDMNILSNKIKNNENRLYNRSGHVLVRA